MKKAPKAYVAPVLPVYNAADVWSAAAAATRINEGYIKEEVRHFNVETGESTIIKEANKTLAYAMLRSNGGWTNEDAFVGQEAREYWQGQTLKILAETANEFEKKAIEVAGKDEVSSPLDIGMIFSLVNSAHRNIRKEAADEIKRNAVTEHYAKVGERVTLEGMEIQFCVYSVKYASYRIDGLMNGYYFNWWGKEKLEPGTKINITARIRSHGRDSRTGAAVTSLNYIKPLEGKKK